MNQLKLFSVILLVAFLTGSALGQHETTPDYGTCADDGDDLMYPPRCPADDENGEPTYFPYPYKCDRFWQCTNRVAKCIKCAEGTVWKQEEKTCVHENDSPCVIVTTPLPTTRPTTTRRTTTIPTTTTEKRTTTTPTTTTEITTTTQSTTTSTSPVPTTSTTEDPANWICPEGFIGRMPHPYNCRLFYNCDPARRPCLFECPSNLYFNPATKNCDWPENVPSCQGGTPPPPFISHSNFKNGMRSPMAVGPCDGESAY